MTAQLKMKIASYKYRILNFILAGTVVLIAVELNAQTEDDFTSVQLMTGDTPPCYTFKPLFGTDDNYLKVTVGGGADVAIKIMNRETDACIRYFYLRSGEAYYSKNIPEGVYYLKIAFGNDFSVSGSETNCMAKFLSNAIYESGNDILDFYRVQSSDGYQVPNYELFLETITSNRKNEFNTETISEEEFLK